MSAFCPRTAADLLRGTPRSPAKVPQKHWCELGRAGCSPRLNSPVNRMSRRRGEERRSKGERVAANGRPLGRAGNLAEVRERFAEHPGGLFADRTRVLSNRLIHLV